LIPEMQAHAGAQGRRRRSGSAAAYVLLLLALAAGQALAEPSSPTPTAAVYDFTEPVTWEGRLVGRRAADAVFLALTEEGQWAQADRVTLQRMCEREGIGPPFGVGHLQMLGERLSAPLAVTGLVEVFEVNPTRGAVQATLLVELVEAIGGASLTSVRGVSSARRSEEEVEPLAVVADRALAEAAGDVARALTGFGRVVASVVMPLPDGRVVLEGPEKPPLSPGDKLLVMRGERALGVLQVATVQHTVIHATPLSGEGFAAGDRALLVAR